MSDVHWVKGKGAKSGGGNGAADNETAVDVGVLDKRLKAGGRPSPSVRITCINPPSLVCFSSFTTGGKKKKTHALIFFRLGQA